VLLRSSENETGLERYARFIRDNPDWPSIPLLRRRAEGRLWWTRADAATVRGFVDGEPVSAVGRLALARADRRRQPRRRRARSSRGMAVSHLDTSMRPTAWLAISDTNFDVQSEKSSL
jgi:hypothetical protein